MPEPFRHTFPSVMALLDKARPPPPTRRCCGPPLPPPPPPPPPLAAQDLRAALAAMPTSGRVAGRCSEEQFWYSSSGCLAPTAEERAEQVTAMKKKECKNERMNA
jgi:hypothetical protein